MSDSNNLNLVLIGVGTSLIAMGISAFFFGRSTDASNGSGDIEEEETMDEEYDHEKFPSGKMTMYFGSQTGTAESFAKLLSEQVQKLGFYPQVVDLEDFDASAFLDDQSGYHVFLMATYGEGDPTDNAMEFYHWLKDECADGALSSLEFSVFGLGNTQYEHYNRTGKSVNQLLERKGGSRFFQYGEGDDDKNLEEDFEAWNEKFLAHLKKNHTSGFDTDDDEEEDEEGKTELPRLDFEVHVTSSEEGPSRSRTSSQIKSTDVQPSSRFYFSSHNALLLTKEELRNTEEDEGSTLHMEFDVSGLHGHGESFYTTADNLAILPENDGDVVETLATFLGYELSDYFTIAASSSSTTTAVKHPFPTPTTVDAFLRKYCDLVSVPRRSTANAILPFIGDSQERARATAMIKNKDIWKEEVEDQKLSYYEILMLFPSIDIPLAHFISIVPKLQPRYYTISSSNLVHPDRVHVTVALVGQEIERPEGSFHKSKLFKGVCTHYLSSLQPEIDSVQLFVRESTFEMPASFETPIILLGPGTGYAPMRALLQERQFLMEQNPSASFGEAVLFFGCKTRTSDFIYQDEIEALTNDEVLSHLLLAFSREQGHKVYVQHMMTSCPEVVHLLADLVLNKGAHIYVCGGTRMGQDILQTFALLLGYFLENNQIEASDEQSEEFQTLVAEDKDFDAFNTSSCAIYDGRYMDAYKASEEEGNFLQRAAPFKERGLALIHEMEGNGRYVQELWS